MFVVSGDAGAALVGSREQGDSTVEIEIVYEYGSLPASELSAELATFVEEYRAGGPAKVEAQAAGFKQLDGVDKDISFKEQGASLDAATAWVIVTILTPVSHIAVTFWDQILLPILQRKYGVDVLGKEISRT